MMKQNVDLIFKNGRVIDGTGAEPIYPGVVVVRGNVIIDVGDASISDEYLPVEVIDLDGMTILPFATWARSLT